MVDSSFDGGLASRLAERNETKRRVYALAKA